MNAWHAAVFGLLLALVPCGWVCYRGRTMERLVAFQLAGTLATLALVALATGEGRAMYLDVAFSTGILALGGALVYARFLERLP